MATAREDSDLLTIAEVAQRLRVHRSTVWKLVRSNRLPAVRLTPRITRISRGGVDALLRGQAVEESAVPPASRGRAERQEDPVVARLRRFQEALLAERGGVPLPDSARILRELRDGQLDS